MPAGLPAAARLSPVPLQSTSSLSLHVQILSANRSVRSFAEAFLARSLPLHCLINNAGLGLPHEAHTEDGFETTIGGLGWAGLMAGLGWAGLGWLGCLTGCASDRQELVMQK